MCPEFKASMDAQWYIEQHLHLHVLAAARPYAHLKRCSSLRIRAVSRESVRHRAYPGSFAAPDISGVGDASCMLTGQYPARGRLTRPRAHRSDFPEAALFFPVMVELRLGK